jgi:3-oxoacyl-[acyl-carrier protein] reductase
VSGPAAHAANEDLRGRTALVTGAGKGIGRAIALALAARGVHVGACGRGVEALDALEAEIRAGGGACTTRAADVSTDGAMMSFVAMLAERAGVPDILIANAGIGYFAPVADMENAAFDRVMAVNVRGVYLSVKAVLPGMQAVGRGDIVVISSLAGKNGFAGGAAYAASKFAVRGFAQSLMLEVRAQGIRVMTVCPGSVDTEFFDSSGMHPRREHILQAGDVAGAVLAALDAPRRAMISDIDIRPSNP